MKNRKVIVINGFQRGGTNIVYNILQSHPQVCSPNDLETGQVIFQSHRIDSHKILKYFIKRIKLAFYGFLNNKFILNSFFVNVIGKLVDLLFYRYKLKTFQNRYNRYKYETIPYTLNEIEDSVLCLKSVHNDIRLTRFLSEYYNEIYFIGLVRNGYALCESWIRRGKNAKYAGLRYKKFGEMMINDSKKIKNYIIIKFEDILANPFEQASKLYKFTRLEPIFLEKLRFKSKKILSINGNHQVRFGKLNAKYWFDSENINDLIQPDINVVQLEKLTFANKRIFEKETKNVLNYLNYI